SARSTRRSLTSRGTTGCGSRRVKKSSARIWRRKRRSDFLQEPHRQGRRAGAAEQGPHSWGCDRKGAHWHAVIPARLARLRGRTYAHGRRHCFALRVPPADEKNSLTAKAAMPAEEEKSLTAKAAIPA